MNHWIVTKDGDERAYRLFQRHYSYRAGNRDLRHRFLFVGPGEKIVLVTPEYDALFVWRKFKSADGQPGVNCSVFRNESKYLSSELILKAEEYARAKWPGERLYTYVSARKVQSANPGYCFKRAGWKTCGITKWNKLTILEKVG